MSRRVVVVGAGVSGLAAAHRLRELDASLEVRVFDASHRAGGIIATERTDGFVIERGPDTMITDKPWGIALVKRLGLEGELVQTDARNRGAYVVRAGRLERIPDGFSLVAPTHLRPLWRTPVLSWRGKLRASIEPLLPRGAPREDESLASFTQRRFGKELFERLSQPLAAGIYGADPELLSMAATMPRFLDAERTGRSVSLTLRRAERKRAAEHASGARYGLFVSFRNGMQTLVDALAERLAERLVLGRAVRALVPRAAGGFVVSLDDGTSLDADAVILAAPARVTGGLLAAVDPDLSRDLLAIRHGSSATVTFGWRRREVGHPLDAFGFVVPLKEERVSLASTWASVKLPGRAPEGHALIRFFLGGAGREHLLAGDDASLVRMARAEARELMNTHAEPLLARVVRYEHAMPQYELGHLGRVREIDARLARAPRLAVAGIALHGVGIPDAIHAGERAAERVRGALA